MTMDPLSILVATTAIISWQLMDSPQKAKWMLIPHACHAHGEWHRVVSHAFVHADWMHLAFNMFVLYEFGQTVLLDLAPLGWMGFPAMYFAGIVAGALPALRKHRFNPAYRSLGASGAVSAVLLAFICLHPTRTLLLFFVIPVPAILAGVLFFWYESRMQRRRGSYVAHDAHLGGALVGVFWAFASMPESLWQSVTALQELIQ